MRKHFLLLFLMALLPLAGWAATSVAYTDVTVTVTWTERAYTGNAETVLPTVSVTGKAGSATSATTIDASNYTLEWKDPSNATFTQASAIKNAGTYTVTVKAKNTGDTFTAATGKSLTQEFKINKVATALVIVAKNPTMTYGGTEPTLTDFYEVMNGGTVLVGGETLDDNATTGIGFPVSLPTIDKVNAGTKNFTLVAREYTNYDISVTQPNGTLTIAQKAITITANNLADITYGAAKPTTMTVANYSANLVGEDKLEGTLAYDFKKIKDATGAAVTETLVDADILPAGTYNVYPKGLSNSNYAITFAPGTLKVNQKTLTPAMLQGIAEVTYNGTNQKPTLKVIDGTEENNLLKATDYTAAWTFLAANATSATTPTAVDESTQELAAAAFTQAGTYTVTLTAAADGNYKDPTAPATKASKNFKINKAELNVKTLNSEKTYDGVKVTPTNNTTYLKYVDLATADASHASTFTGITVSLEDGAKAGSRKGIDADKYRVIATGELPTVLASNYTPVFGNIGYVTIKEREITITPNPIKKNYGAVDTYADGKLATGQAANAEDLAEGKFQLTGTLAANETFTTMPTLTREAGEAARNYDLIPSAAVITNNNNTTTATTELPDPTSDDVDVTKNYKITYAPSTFTIVAGGFRIYAEDKTSVFGQELKELTYVVDGIPAADAAKIVFGEGAITTTAKANSNRGTYTITIDKEKINFSAIAADYDIDAVTVVPGDYIITPAPLKIKAKDQAHIVGETVTAADLKNIEFVTEGVSATDKAGVVANITLAFYNGATASAKDVPVDGDKKLTDDAAANGWTGTAAATAAKDKGIWVNGIEIKVTADDYWNTANYTLTGEGAETKAGTLYVTVANTPVTFDILATATTQISDVAGKIVDAKISKNEAGKKRTLYANEWNSLVLPFDITPFAFCDAIDGYAVFDVLQTTGEAMNFKITINEIPAYTPFLVKVSETVVLSEKVFSGVVIKAIADAAVANDAYIFQGNLAMSTPVPAWLFTADSEHSSKVEFGSIDLYHNVENAPTTAPNRPCPAFGAYIKAKSGVQAAPSIFIEEADGSTTAITAINADGVAVKAEGWYTINGVKLQGMPTEKGIYINNGKKIVIK